MKIIFLGAFYNKFLNHFKSKNIYDTSSMSYEKIQYLLLEEFFGDIGSLFHYSKITGANCQIIICNFEDLQKKWAEENGITYDEKNWMYDIAALQIIKFKPDLLYVDSLFNFHGKFLSEIKPSVRKIISWISCPIPPNLSLEHIDLILSSTPAYVKYFNEKGIKAKYTLPAFDSRVLDVIPYNHQKDIPFSFVGGLSPVHINRKKALLQLSKYTPISIWGYDFTLSRFNILNINRFLDERRMMKHYKGESWGLDMYTILSRSIITFNIHESLLQGYVGNMRMMEASGMGCLLLNDRGININTLFDDSEIEVYDSIEEAIEKIKFYLQNPQKAIQMGLNAQKRTLKDYNYPLFVENMFQIYSKI